MKRNLVLLGVMISAVAVIIGCGSIPTTSSTTTTTSITTTTVLSRDFSLPTPLYSSSSPWNQTVTSAAVLASSEAQLLVTYRVLLGDKTNLSAGTGVNVAFPYMYVNHVEYCIPIFRMGSGQQIVAMRDYSGSATANNPKLPGTTVTVTGPASAVRPSGPQTTSADGHLVLYNPTTRVEYDFWQATTSRDASGSSLGGGQVGSTIYTAGGVDYFDTQGPGVNPDTYFSARASGVPLMAGCILPEDIESGTINHALGFAIPGTRNTNIGNPSSPNSSDYCYPAAYTETNYYNTNPNSLGSGQRLRLKANLVDESGSPINESGFAPITQKFLSALRTYGGYCVDNSSAFAFYAEDINSANLNLTTAEVNTLVGQVSSLPIPAGKTKWQVVLEKLNSDLESIPFAASIWQAGDPTATATASAYNFEVVVSPSRP